MKWLEEILGSLAIADKAAISLAFIAGGRLSTPINSDELTIKTLSSLGSNIGEVKASLPKLNGTFLRFDQENQTWCFRHPTIRDAFATIIGSNPELIDIYLAGVTTEQLMQEVTCGDLGLEGVKIIIPQERFGIVLGRLRRYKQKKEWLVDYYVETFLAHRCSGIFLQRYHTEEDIAMLPQEIRSLGGYDKPLRILFRLHSDGLLPESIREETVKYIKSVSINSYSIDFLNERNVGCLLTAEEKQSQWDTLKDYVLSDREEIIKGIRDSWDGESDPYSEFDDLRSTLEEIMDQGNDEEVSVAEVFVDGIRDVISDMEEDQLSKAEYETLAAEETTVESASSSRSIFDDVDE